jgi:hypothetical protein
MSVKINTLELENVKKIKAVRWQKCMILMTGLFVWNTRTGYTV